MKWTCLFFLLGYLFVGEHVLSATASKRFRDVMTHGTAYSWNKYHHRLDRWYSDQNNWNDKLYPTWEKGDSRWKNCWKGGRVVASLISDSPALVGSNVTFTAMLKFPRCQKEDNDSNIIYDRTCLNNSSVLSDKYVYNWTQWIDDCSWVNCTHNNSYNVFPDGKSFPYHHGWRRRNFIFIFHTLGQYYQIKGGSSVMMSINTTNITVGKQIMELAVYRRGYRSYVPVTTSNAIYVVTDQIPFYVNISQKNNRNISDFIFIKDIPIMFDVRIHDPSHYLNHSAISYHWNFGDGSGSFVSNNSISTHTYTLLGNFSADLSVQAIIPVPCGPVTPSPLSTFPAFTTQLPSNTTLTSPNLTEVPTGQPPVERCSITRYGTYKATLTIVEGILEVNIVQMTSVQMTATQVGSSMVDFVVTCQGSLPTDACTLIADPTCTILHSESCHPVDIADVCFLTIRRAFNESGTYCVNITLADATSLALTSTLISINGAEASFSRTAEGILVTCGFLVVLGSLLTFFLYKRYKEYKPIERKSGQGKSSEGLSVYFNNVKAVLFPRGNERDPLLKKKLGIV
ncbi:transmembrane glycoprotein NMB [Pantherophis guttatus]|uniref:Transmembrane glycoprotein NMB n=1 Tax=Pantherophis guttatus TaxID=94885 RepID=A0A6P9AQB8_PANGU|nr:transmembrane glycoprotein NMB [Pantherophis guttatus]